MSASPVSIVPPAPDAHAAPDAAASASPHSPPAARPVTPPVTVRWLGETPYDTCFDAMRAFTDARTPDTGDEIWVVEHPPVYTLGQAGNPAHLLVADSGVPLVKVDRGGQITYHGPGQIVAYLLVDLRRRKLMVRTLVTRIEEAVIETLAAYNLASVRKAGAPGIYVESGPHRGAKIAALGLKIRNGCSYHGLSVNVKMDLRPFLAINPCGYAGLETIDMASLGATADWHEVAQTLVRRLIANLDGATAAAALPPQALEQSND
ncbi:MULTISPECIES: lipoyl(octanoyl) transferase LipB [Burkholderia]|uniref:Octanoyltransferase n=1 Tax=Burkholderia humptydooensis TaxID=430531 RepID=A0A7U4P6G6_9BURK|nr:MULTISPECIES: lipoyl(octanoyl) transferase LipB [Burkholderia]AGK48552.1 lipoyl(octanoyl) transferase [Burkholderia thailandensis MSMB121]ATF34994.1 lipoate--protein ligase [Burkholderia thailandensis]AJY41869.1 lipoyl(octanoyl) transferase [Burkholderia sp. 2002721687]ALX43875.1 lipoate--protein ligase [Burkholderia humptydooensis]KST75570.1 lipoate--protein ligase [Burkholderia humptydooensis]